MAHELEHGLLQFGLSHLPVPHADARPGHHFLEGVGALPDGIYAIVQEVDLPATSQLQLQRLADKLRLEWRHYGVDGEAVFGRRLDHRHIAQAQQRHV